MVESISPCEVSLDYSDSCFVHSGTLENRYKACWTTYQECCSPQRASSLFFQARLHKFPRFDTFPQLENMASTMTVAETATHPSACPAFPFSRPERFEPPAENAGLRLNEPISKVKLFDGTECWVVARHSDVREVLASDKFSAVSISSLQTIEP